MCVVILLSPIPQRSHIRLVDVDGDTKDVFSGGGTGKVTEKYECPLLRKEGMPSTAEKTIAHADAWRQERIGFLQIADWGRIGDKD